jgi:hypothetical protein
LGQLDGKDLTARVTAVGKVPANGIELTWLVDGQPVAPPRDLSSQEVQSGIRLNYPNPIPLPGQYTVRVTVNGVKSKDFSFRIND